MQLLKKSNWANFVSQLVVKNNIYKLQMQQNCRAVSSHTFCVFTFRPAGQHPELCDLWSTADFSLGHVLLSVRLHLQSETSETKQISSHSSPSTVYPLHTQLTAATAEKMWPGPNFHNPPCVSQHRKEEVSLQKLKSLQEKQQQCLKTP